MARAFPDAEEAFHTKQEVITSKVSQNLEKWGVNKDWYQDEVLTRKMTYVAAYEVCKDPATATKAARKKRDEARADYQAILSQLVELLKALPAVTHKDLDDMEIAYEKGGGKPAIPVTHHRPAMRVRLITSGMIEIDFLNSETGGHGKPRGGSGILLALGIAGASPDDHDSDEYRMDAPAVDQEQLPFTMYITDGKVILEFKKHQAGLQLEAAACWTNATGKRGPWADIITITIP
jgi:hypothetical protein